MANAAAWAVLAGLIGLAFVLVVVLGPFGLILLGLITLVICTSVELQEDTPTWGVEVFKARIARARTPEQHAAKTLERQIALQPIRFYRWCGVVMLLAGVAGFLWQSLR
jgi:hypothetical protein